MADVLFEGGTYRLQPGETVLEGLLRGGANVPFSCRKGTCQVCMLQAVEGQPGPEAVEGLRPGLSQVGMFLPCRACPQGRLVVQRPDPADLFTKVEVHAKEWLSSRVCRLLLEPETSLAWKPGQFVNVRRSDGVVRSYSIASIAEQDYFLELHVKRLPTGVMSRWLCDDVEPGTRLEVQGPLGTCYYEPESREQDLLLLATGSGLSPLLGICRQALSLGHRGQIRLYHGSRFEDGLYLRGALRELAERHENFSYVPCLSREPVPTDVELGRVVDLAFAAHPQLQGWRVYLCGIPAMVHEGRYRAVLAGVERGEIRADPFEFTYAFMPDDKAKIGAIEPDPELWEALGGGPGLSAILEDFYGRVYEDPLLFPFFHRVTKKRAIEKQYSFLADLFTGRKDFFGLRPFNAHHWMIISDKLFDYREAMFDGCLSRYGLPEHLARRWRAIHELFRREMVKSSARGLIIDGVEQVLEGYSEVTVEFGTLCDGCTAEMSPGDAGRFHNRTGELYCASCEAVQA